MIRGSSALIPSWYEVFELTNTSINQITKKYKEEIENKKKKRRKKELKRKK